MKEWNYNKIKFYKYFFVGVKKPIVMEAINRDMADEMLNLLPERTGVFIDLNRLEQVKIEMPITGISEKVRDGKTYVWVGEKHSDNGWMLKDEFEKIIE